MPINNLTRITVVGYYALSDLTAAAGSIAFTPSAILHDAALHATVFPVTQTAILGDDGTFTIDLIADDDPDETPSFVWEVSERISGQGARNYNIHVPSDTVGPLQLCDLAPATAPDTSVSYVLQSTFNATIADLASIYLPLSARGAASGVASLGSDGLVPLAQLPATGGGGTTVTTVGAAGADYITDGTADEVQINQAIAAVGSAGGGAVFVKAGTYSIAAPIVIRYSNVHLLGAGAGATTIVCASSMTGNVSAIDVGSTAAQGADRALTADTAVGDTTVTMGSSDSATFADGDYVLLKSNKQVDSESSGKLAGEIHRVVSGASGTVTFTDIIKDTYLVADSAAVAKIPYLRNVALRDFTVTSAASTSTLSGAGFVNCKFIDNLLVSGVEISNGFATALYLRSCLNATVVKSAVLVVRDGAAVSDNYGIGVGCASENVLISGCHFRKTRHSVTTGGATGPNNNGVQRQVLVTGCLSEQTEVGHFDTHDPADGVAFVGNTCIGSSPRVDGTSTNGIQSRAKNVLIANNVIRLIRGHGVHIFNARSAGTAVVGNQISDIKATSTGAEGTGVWIAAGTGGHLITGNMIKDCDLRAIYGLGSNHDTVISGNRISGAPLIASASVLLVDTLRPVITGNSMTGNTTSKPIQTTGTSGSALVTGNIFNGNTFNLPVLVGTGNSVHNNQGTNPHGPYAQGNVSGSVTFTRVNGSQITATLTGNITVNLTAGQWGGDELVLILAQDGTTGGHTAAWPSNFKKAGGSLPLSTAAGAVDVITLTWDAAASFWREKSRTLATA